MPCDDVRQFIQQLRDDDGRVSQADQGGPAFCCAGGMHAPRIDGDVKQHARCFLVGLAQRDGGGQGGLAGFNGAFSRRTAPGLRPHIKPQGLCIGRCGLNELDHEKIVMLRVFDLPNGKLW